MVSVIDTFCFNGEWVVPMRLEYLNDWVDAFVIVESHWTHSGLRKPQLFKDIYADWFVPYAHKIHWVIVNDFPEVTAEWLETYRAQSWMRDNQVHWFREAYQRDVAGDYIRRHLLGGGNAGSAGDCIVHVSDADEIPNVSLFHSEFKPAILAYTVPVYLEQVFFYYNFHWRKTYKWHRAYVIPGAQLTAKGTSLTQWRVCPSTDSFIVSNAGWHFSYFMTPEELQKKLAAFAHRECDQERWNSLEHIHRCISQGLDLFERDNEAMTYYDPEADPTFPRVFLSYRDALIESQVGSKSI